MADKIRPEKTLKLEESGVEITMTYVIFNDVLRFVGSIDEALSSLMTNQDVRDLVIRRLLSDSKKPIEDLKDLIPIEDVDVDIFELDDILAWTVEHIAYFFTRTVTKMHASVSKFPEVAEKMKMSSNLSENGSTPSQT